MSAVSLYRYIASANVHEIFTAASLLLVLGAALFMDLLGLSIALGTFIAGVLSQGGEFAFVMFSAASAQKILTGDQLSLLLVIITLSMITTPLMMQLIDSILVRRYNAVEEDDEKPFVNDDEPQVIIVGLAVSAK